MLMGAIPKYKELYSISDLHLGGVLPRGQIFGQAQRLRLFLRSLADKPGPLVLVIAGDLFDSLPHLTGTGTYIAIDNAAAIMNTIMVNPSFAPVFDGLKTFLTAADHELVILIGNHDLEIAFPETQEELLGVIAPTAAARGRVRFSTSGVGFRCQVGAQVVYVTHGNEADPWNHVEHEALRRVAHMRTLGQHVDPSAWVPNAGTKLVIDVMNSVKAAHPFIDLLKPETRAAVKVLAVLDPKATRKLFDALPAFADAIWAHAGPHVVLGGRSQTRPAPPVVRLLGEAANDAFSVSGNSQPDTLLAHVERLQESGVRPTRLVSDADTTLGIIDYVWDRWRGLSDVEALRRAVADWATDDESFTLSNEDSTFKGILSQVSPGIDVVITGHTHLPRWITVDDRRLTYLNAGAWARVIGVRKDFLEDESTFAPIHRALMGKEMSDLDKATVKVKGRLVPLVLDATVAAHVTDGPKGAVAELLRITHRGARVREDPIDPKSSVLSWR